MSQTSSFASTRFAESERHNIKLDHSDFAQEQNFDYLQETEDLNNFLLSKSWDNYFDKYTKNGPYAKRRCETSIANQIFKTVLASFQFRMDTVQIFHIITEFYDIDAKWYFERLVQQYRKRLQNDLEHRIGKFKKQSITKIGEDKIRFTFESIFGQ